MNRKEERRQRRADSGAQMPRRELVWLGFGCRRVGKSLDFTESEKEQRIPCAVPSQSGSSGETPRLPTPLLGSTEALPGTGMAGRGSGGLRETNSPQTLQIFLFLLCPE